MVAIAIHHHDVGSLGIAGALVAMFVFGVMVGKDKGQPR